jgi:hypothetical protein
VDDAHDDHNDNTAHVDKPDYVGAT